MLWNLIFDFYVMYIFGGVASNEEAYYTFFGYNYVDDEAYLTATFEIPFFNNTLQIGSYFSLIATIITMIIILIVIGHFIKKTFNLFGRII